MSRVLDKFSTKEADAFDHSILKHEHWQTRARKLKNRKWRELNRKIMNENHAI